MWTERSPRGAALALVVGALVHSVPGSAQDAAQTVKRVAPGSSALMFTVASFDGACRPTAMPAIELLRTPAIGAVTFKPGLQTTVQFSLSGKCVGTVQNGVGIHYQASNDAAGEDNFAIVVKMPTGETATRSFRVLISSDVAAVAY